MQACSQAQVGKLLYDLAASAGISLPFPLKNKGSPSCSNPGPRVILFLLIHKSHLPEPPPEDSLAADCASPLPVPGFMTEPASFQGGHVNLADADMTFERRLDMFPWQHKLLMEICRKIWDHYELSTVFFLHKATGKCWKFYCAEARGKNLISQGFRYIINKSEACGKRNENFTWCNWQQPIILSPCHREEHVASLHSSWTCFLYNPISSLLVTASPF